MVLKVLDITRTIAKTKNLRICGVPPCGSGETRTATAVAAKNTARGRPSGGNSSFSPPSNRAASDKASRICDTAMENRIDAAEANPR
jgi:hypothetical protein